MKAVYTYDYGNRRARKLLYRYSSGQWSETPVEDTILLYDGWLPVMMWQDNTGMGTTDFIRACTWGLDLAGLNGETGSIGVSPVDSGSVGVSPVRRASAGGIGGLLAVREERDASYPGGNGTFCFLFTHDGTGNVGQVLDLSPATWDAEAVMVARYEYEPYGGLRSSAGGYASRNPFRFSTKYWDAESGLGDWGRRFYRPDTGRWMNRDPIEERGGKNLYAYAANQPASNIDAHGLLSLSEGCPAAGPTSRPAHKPNPRPKDVPRGKNWGTCKDCDKKCGRDTGRYGVTSCEGGKPCYCVCGSHIWKQNNTKMPGAAAAWDMIETCVYDHENVHVKATRCRGNTKLPDPPGHNEECRADGATAACLYEALDRCRTSGEPCRCTLILQDHVRTHIHCDKNKKEHTNCPKKDVSDCLKNKKKLKDELAAIRRANHCKGVDSDTKSHR